jgi:predicted DNA-binding transcriptional regulator AlpA
MEWGFNFHYIGGVMPALHEVTQESCTPFSNPQPELPRLVLEGYLRREELAQQLSVSPRTIDRWQALRKGPPRVRVGRTILYNVQSVREWLISRERKAFDMKRRRSSSGIKT